MDFCEEMGIRAGRWNEEAWVAGAWALPFGPSR